MSQTFQISVLSFMLLIIDSIEFTYQDWLPPTPRIYGRNYAYVNETINLTCIINHHADAFFSIFWNYTNNDNPRIKISDTKQSILKSKDGSAYWNVERNLTVENAQLSDSGIYFCAIEEKRGFVMKKNQQGSFLKIIEPGTCVLNITTEMTNVINAVTSEENVFLDVRFEAFPSANITWKKENELIRSGDGEGKYLINDTEIKSKLLIKKINRKDSANYTMTISQCNESSDISFTLNVWEKPSVTIYPIYNTYLRSSKNNITCKAEGNPRPRIEWEWQPCLNHSCEVQENHFEVFNNLKYNSKIVERETSDPGTIISYIEFKSEESGHFRCKAINDYGVASDSYFLVESDYMNGFAINASDSKVIEGGFYKLECGISLFSYNSLFWEWKPKNSENDEYIQIDAETNDIKLENKSSSETFAQAIVWDKMSQNNSGIYVCNAINAISGKRERLSKTIEISGNIVDGNDPTCSIYLTIIILFSFLLVVLIAIIIKKTKNERDNRKELELTRKILFQPSNSNTLDFPLDDDVITLLPKINNGDSLKKN